MAMSLYNTKSFKIIDGTLYFVGEFLLWLVIFAPIISLLYGFVFETDGTLQFKIDKILHAFNNYSLPVAIVFITFVRSIITMTINVHFLLLTCIIGFFIVIYIWFGLKFMILISSIALLIFILNKITLVHNFIVDKLNALFKMWKLFLIEKEQVHESVSYGQSDNKKNNEILSKLPDLVFFSIFIILSSILIWQLWIILHMRM